jgi:ADP-heptose:LPS heptosyltransferase
MPAQVIGTLGAHPAAGPHIEIPGEALSWRRNALPSGPLLALYLDAPAAARVWPAARFAELAERFLAAKPDASAVALAGPTGGTRLAEFLRSAPRSPRVFGFDGLPLSHVAAAIGGARLLVSNDTGPMHLGPALGTPTLGLFSIGLPEHFAPTGPNDRFLRANPIDQLSVDTVLDVAQTMWRSPN